MEALSSYLREVSLLGLLPTTGLVVAAGGLLLLVNLALTLLHTNQERRGKLWDYFGHVEGVRIPDSVGFVLFFLLLTAWLWLAGLCAFTAAFLLSTGLGMFFVGYIIGGRISDCFYSHLSLDKKYRQHAANPGLGSVPFYLVEAGYLVVLFLPGLIAGWHAAAGILAGWATFAFIRPLLRRFAPSSWRQPRWVPAA